MNLDAFFEGFLEKIASEDSTRHWTSYDSAKEHAKKHAPGLAMSEEQYLTTAAKLFNQRHELKKVFDRKKNAEVYWDSSKGFKLVVSPHGKIVTMYHIGTKI